MIIVSEGNCHFSLCWPILKTDLFEAVANSVGRLSYVSLMLLDLCLFKTKIKYT